MPCYAWSQKCEFQWSCPRRVIFSSHGMTLKVFGLWILSQGRFFEVIFNTLNIDFHTRKCGKSLHYFMRKLTKEKHVECPLCQMQNVFFARALFFKFSYKCIFLYLEEKRNVAFLCSTNSSYTKSGDIKFCLFIKGKFKF